MRAKTFAAWAASKGLPGEECEKLVRAAATKKQMREAIDMGDPAPPVYTIDDIVEMTDQDLCDVSPLENGFIVVGGCFNGDLILIDVQEEKGSVWYASHEGASGGNLRSRALRVAADVTELVSGYGGEIPVDYHEAKQNLGGRVSPRRRRTRR